MSDSKSERLGLRGTLALFESVLKLLGGANATGAVAMGAAFHAFGQNAGVRWWVAVAALLFLFGLLAFVVAYATWFMMTIDLEHSMHEADEVTGPEAVLWNRTKTNEEYRKAAKKNHIGTVFIGVASFAFFLAGLSCIFSLSLDVVFADVEWMHKPLIRW